GVLDFVSPPPSPRRGEGKAGRPASIPTEHPPGRGPRQGSHEEFNGALHHLTPAPAGRTAAAGHPLTGTSWTASMITNPSVSSFAMITEPALPLSNLYVPTLTNSSLIGGGFRWFTFTVVEPSAWFTVTGTFVARFGFAEYETRTSYLPAAGMSGTNFATCLPLSLFPSCR